jgi:outer membrane protein OmpA-like peptidoglycan-associated protein
MKILIIGFIVLFGWSAFSTHLYVCKIKGLCDEPNRAPISATIVKSANTVNTVISSNEAKSIDSVSEVITERQKIIPEKLMVYFEFDKYDFKSEIVTVNYLNDSKKYLDQNLQSKLNITGYTDAVGTDEYNMDLGYRRAKSVQNYFMNKGIPAEKFIIASKGEKEPAGDNNTTSGRAKNRRTSISIKN